MNLSGPWSSLEIASDTDETEEWGVPSIGEIWVFNIRNTTTQSRAIANGPRIQIYLWDYQLSFYFCM